MFALLLNAVLFVVAIVPSASMEPEITAGSLVVAWRPAVWTAKPQIGEIVLFRKAEIDSALLLKRVTGLPGDVVPVSPESTVFKKRGGGGAVIATVPEGYYYLCGDNAAASNDARHWVHPFVPQRDILALVIFVIGKGQTKWLG